MRRLLFAPIFDDRQLTYVVIAALDMTPIIRTVALAGDDLDHRLPKRSPSRIAPSDANLYGSSDTATSMVKPMAVAIKMAASPNPIALTFHTVIREVRVFDH